jgi:hypothetical protein
VENTPHPTPKEKEDVKFNEMLTVQQQGINHAVASMG